jgi:hypothetical protein
VRSAGLAAVAAVVAVPVLAGACATTRSEADVGAGAGVVVRLVIADMSIREPDVTCSGAGPYRFAHPEAPYTVHDPSGEQVASGTLPQGTAERAWNVDLGDTSREPTNCVMMIDIPELETVEGHSLVIDSRSPMPMVPNPNLDDIPEVVLS